MTSSFKKKKAGKPTHPLGSRPSLYNAQLLVSSGVPSMDSLLGGGLAVGTVLLLEEDVYGSYSRLLLKYFLSEGVMCGHSLLVASAKEKTKDILKDLPGAVNDERLSSQAGSEGRKDSSLHEDDPESSSDSVAMKIAWRYNNLPKIELSFSNQFGHSYDLTAKMPAERVGAVDVVHFNAPDVPMRSCGGLYAALKETIEETIHQNHFSVDEAFPKQRNILRIGLQSLGSPLWLDEGGVTNSSHSLFQFLHCLRALLRRAYAVAMVTVPTHLMQGNSVHIKRIRRMCDVAVRLESFAGSDKETNPVFKDYHGLFHIHKIPCLNSLTRYHPETLDLAFKLKRKKFSIEKLHLPPELSDTASRAQEDQDTKSQSKGTEETRKKKVSIKDIDF